MRKPDSVIHLSPSCVPCWLLEHYLSTTYLIVTSLMALLDLFQGFSNKFDTVMIYQECYKRLRKQDRMHNIAELLPA